MPRRARMKTCVGRVGTGTPGVGKETLGSALPNVSDEANHSNAVVRLPSPKRAALQMSDASTKHRMVMGAHCGFDVDGVAGLPCSAPHAMRQSAANDPPTAFTRREMSTL